MLGDPVSKPKEYSDIMCYYSRQACGRMVNTLFTRLRMMAIASAVHAGSDSSNSGVLSSGLNHASSTGAYMGHAQGHSHFISHAELVGLPPAQQVSEPALQGCHCTCYLGPLWVRLLKAQ